MKVIEKHYVTFDSPGTFFLESSTREIASWDVQEAVKMSEDIVERYGAKPFGFRFSTRLETDEGVDDGRGGVLEVQAKKISESPTHFLGGEVLTYDDFVRRNDDEEEILRSNMKCNRWWVMVVNTNSYKTTRPLNTDDVVLGENGDVIAKGSDYKEYCEKMNKWADEDEARMMKEWEEERANGTRGRNSATQ